MEQIFSQLFYEVEKHRDTVLVTLIADRGSAPRKAGAQMLVGAEGRLVGTIGGGAVEYQAVEEARALWAQGDGPAVRHYDLSPDAAGLGMVCGGSISVLLEQIG